MTYPTIFAPKLKTISQNRIDSDAPNISNVRFVLYPPATSRSGTSPAHSSNGPTICQVIDLLERSCTFRWLGMFRAACQVAVVRLMPAVHSRTKERSSPNKASRVGARVGSEV